MTQNWTFTQTHTCVAALCLLPEPDQRCVPKSAGGCGTGRKAGVTCCKARLPRTTSSALVTAVTETPGNGFLRSPIHNSQMSPVTLSQDGCALLPPNKVQMVKGRWPIICQSQRRELRKTARCPSGIHISLYILFFLIKPQI